MSNDNTAAEGAQFEFTRRKIKQTRGRVIHFNSRSLASMQWEARTQAGTPVTRAFVILEGQGGELVAFSESISPHQEVIDETRALLVRIGQPPAGWTPADEAWVADVYHQRLAVMEFFSWEDRARTMARKLGWDTKLVLGE